MKVFGSTNKGNERELNEDTFLSSGLSDGCFAVVCDGMGGENAGEVASRIAADSALAYIKLNNSADIPIPESDSMMREAFRESNKAVYDYSLKSTGFKGMGTTMVAALVKPYGVIIGNIGDSRAYYYINDELLQITTDHSLVENLVQSGQISREMARYHPRRNVITRALGSENDIECDTFSLKPQPGTAILLCSDGLTNELNNDTIYETIRTTADEQVCDQLISLANAAGGRDNITAVLISFREDN